MPQLNHAKHAVLATRKRLLIPLAFMILAALACNLGAQPPGATATPNGTASTAVALSDVPEVEIRSPADNSEVIIKTEVQVYVRALDKVGVTRIEMRADNLIVDTAASPEANGTPTMDSILSWTPNSVGPHVIQVVAFRGNIRGNPKQITLQVRETAAQVTKPAGSPAFLTASPTSDPTCRLRVDTDNLNVRTGPGINYGRVASLALGSTVPIIGIAPDRSWYQVNVQGLVGWVSASFATPLGVCSNLFVVPVPPSPTAPVGATAFILPPTFTPLPTLPPATPSSTIPVVVLPTLTWTPIPTQGIGQASAGDMSSTAIFATQTKLAQPNTPTQGPPTGTSIPGVTPSVTLTPTLTPTPLQPNIVINSVATSSTTVILDPVQQLATVPFVIQVANTGQAPAPVFQVTVRLPNGTSTSINTTIVLAPQASTEITVNATFNAEGPQRVIIIADSSNVVIESNEQDNVAFKDMTVIVATVQGATNTPTWTPSPIPTTLVPPTTVVPPTTEVPPTVVTQAATEPPTAEPPTLIPTTQSAPATEAPTLTHTPTSTSTVEVASVPTTVVPPTIVPTTVEPPTATFTFTPEPPTAEPPTATFTFTPEPPTAEPPTATFTFTPEPPTAEPPTATFTFTPEPPTAEPPTAVPPTTVPTVDLFNVPVLPDLNADPVKNNIKNINNTGKQNGVNPQEFRAAGDSTLAGAVNINDPASNLAATFPDHVDAAQFFTSGFAAAAGPSANDSFTSDALVHGSIDCNGQATSPIGCALSAKPATLLISVGRADVASNVPTETFKANLTEAVNASMSAGTIPILVTIVGVPGDQEPKLAEYNTVIYNVANEMNVPLFNLYAIRKDNPNLVNPANGKLTDPGEGQRANFAPEGLNFGLNVANLRLLQLLDALKDVVPLTTA
jgi:hypothetical protein